MLYTLRTGVAVHVDPELDSEAKTIVAAVQIEAEEKSSLPIHYRLEKLIGTILAAYESQLSGPVLQQITLWGYPTERADDPRNPLVNYGVSKYGITKTTHPQTQDALDEAAQYFEERFIVTHSWLHGGLFPADKLPKSGPYEIAYATQTIGILKEIMFREANSN